MQCESLSGALSKIESTDALYRVGDFVKKRAGPHWRGRVVGYYSTGNTPIGYVVESIWETGSVLPLSEAALERYDPPAGIDAFPRR